LAVSSNGEHKGVEKDKILNCGVKFCGGCNSRYERMDALKDIKSALEGRVNFEYANEEGSYDFILVIGGCTNRCASFTQYKFQREVIKMWDLSCVSRVISEIEEYIKMEAR